ncbi:L-aspartate oxidase [Oceanirhabdus sp. W0125-5]|uniref:L-aspartate oxidase n=1 Tax=Oceanirhabdus sp. W0125-5 TaxID=2999116 RepID=UPI0022F32953|nr:L-aspartate oxidase [Oceanirhabdus sp. W0125-5]WBW96380.1 L-aspartate oxidase [Oceanirhabdus sp. W0125-5]
MKVNTDVLIVGAGIAGLYTALNIDENIQVLIVTKGEVNCCNSFLAQGGISVARDESDYDRFIEDTCRAGGNINSLQAVDILVRESRENINRLIELGVEFDKNEEDFDYTREGAHRINRILHCEDRTGAVVHDVLIKRCKERKNIKLMENCLMENLIIKDERCLGIRIIFEDKEDDIFAKTVVMATGGVGGIFKSTTNRAVTKGEGMEIALSHGIVMRDMDKIQFHPTALYEKGKKERFLISESVRGEGGILINHKGERFVDELMSRDKVSRAIHKELKESGEEHVFLDMRHLGEVFISSRFPSIYKECLKRGIDITKELIPVLPAQHYIMGGIEVDMNSRSSMGDLYAVGEVSCTGVHGNNRLASNSLLESLVFSRRAAGDINKELKKECFKPSSVIYIENMKSIVKSEYKSEGLLREKILSLRGDLKDELCGY